MGMSEEIIFTFKQGNNENFEKAWTRIFDAYSKTEPKMPLSLLLNSFYFGLVLCFRYALDSLVGGDFLKCDGDQAFNVIKKLIAAYKTPSKLDASIISIENRLSTLETGLSSMSDCYNHLREQFDHVAINSEPPMWFPTLKVAINNMTFRARCDIMSEFCLMPENIYESLSLWELSNVDEEINFANDATISPLGKSEGVFTQILEKMVSIDYLVIECVGTGQITLGRSLLRLLGAVIDVGKGTMKIAPPGCGYMFPMDKKKKKNKSKRKGLPEIEVVSSLGN